MYTNKIRLYAGLIPFKIKNHIFLPYKSNEPFKIDPLSTRLLWNYIKISYEEYRIKFIFNLLLFRNIQNNDTLKI